MGVTGLYPVVAQYTSELSTRSIPAGASIQVDGSAVIHGLLSAHTAAIINKGGSDYSDFYQDLVSQMRLWKARGSVHWYVDGARLESKLANGSRSKRRSKMSDLTAVLEQRRASASV
jgi:hypothetical protein